MVPEQAGQDQKVERVEEPSGPAAHGPGALQPHHSRNVRRRDGRPTRRHVFLGPTLSTFAVNCHTECYYVTYFV